MKTNSASKSAISDLNFGVLKYLLLITFILMFSLNIILNNTTGAPGVDELEAIPHSNDSAANATTIGENMYLNLNLSENDVDWYKFPIEHDGILRLYVTYDTKQGAVDVFIYDYEMKPIANSTAEPSERNYKNVTAELNYQEKYPEMNVAYVKIERSAGTGDTANIPYQMNVDFMTTGDSKGFYISEDLLAQGYKPNTLLLLLTYIFLGSVIILWVQFGVSFINKGRKSKRSNEAQGTYYRGLGVFIISVAFSESTYIIDLINRDVNERRFFKEYNSAETFYTFINTDYYFVSIVLMLFGLIFLMYPLEKYLYARKSKVMTYTLIAALPVPIILRYLEIHHAQFGFDLSSEHTTHYQIFMILWVVVVLIGAIAILNLLRLYLMLGSKAPKGSKLKKKSHQIIGGLFLWIISIFSSGWTTKAVSDVKSDWGPYSEATTGISHWFASNHLYYLLPFIMPIFLYLALHLLAVGFTREYVSDEE